MSTKTRIVLVMVILIGCITTYLVANDSYRARKYTQSIDNYLTTQFELKVLREIVTNDAPLQDYQWEAPSTSEVGTFQMFLIWKPYASPEVRDAVSKRILHTMSIHCTLVYINADMKIPPSITYIELDNESKKGSLHRHVIDIETIRRDFTTSK